MWEPSVTLSVPPVLLLFSEYPSVVWTPKRMPGRSMLSCAPKSATLPVKVDGLSSHSVPVGPAKVTSRVEHLDFEHGVGGDRCGCIARLLLDDRRVGDSQVTSAVIA